MTQPKLDMFCLAGQAVVDAFAFGVINAQEYVKLINSLYAPVNMGDLSASVNTDDVLDWPKEWGDNPLEGWDT